MLSKREELKKRGYSFVTGGPNYEMLCHPYYDAIYVYDYYDYIKVELNEDDFWQLPLDKRLENADEYVALLRITNK